MLLVVDLQRLGRISGATANPRPDQIVETVGEQSGIRVEQFSLALQSTYGFLIRRHARDGQRQDFSDRKRCRALQEERFTAADDASLLVRKGRAFGAAYAFLQDAVGTLRSGGSFAWLSELFGGPGRYFARIGLAWCGNTEKKAGTD
jgi:hypothetical protein